MDPATERDRLLALGDAELSARCDFEFIKGTGNGGQHRNKTASAVRVRLRGADFSAYDCGGRSQHRNRAAALYKLRLELALRCRNDPPVPPGRLRCAVAHADYPLWCARLLDALAAAGWELKIAAAALGLSTSALNKLLHRDPELLVKVNLERGKRQLPPLCHP